MKKMILIIAIILLFAAPAFSESLDDWTGKTVEVHLDLSSSKRLIKGTLKGCDEQGVIIDSSEGKVFIYHYSISYIALK
jgi:ribosome maturation factor RimP